MLSSEVGVFLIPFAQMINAKYTLTQPADVKLQLVNITGQIVSEVQLPGASAGNHEFSFDGSDLASGVYFLNIITDNNRVTKKVIKAN